MPQFLAGLVCIQLIVSQNLLYSVTYASWTFHAFRNLLSLFGEFIC